MTNTGLRGPYRLDKTTVDRVVARLTPGAYALGEKRRNTFYISYVGRSDDDVHARLMQWVGHYATFKFEHYSTARAAFEKECLLWHDFGGDQGKLDNERHPARPSGTSWQCPRCDVFRVAVGW